MSHAVEAACRESLRRAGLPGRGRPVRLLALLRGALEPCSTTSSTVLDPPAFSAMKASPVTGMIAKSAQAGAWLDEARSRSRVLDRRGQHDCCQ